MPQSVFTGGCGNAPAPVPETVTTVTGTVAGHVIGIYTNETGATVTINETLTTLGVVAGNLVYVDEAGATTTIPLPADVITAITNVQSTGHEIGSYTNEAGVTVSIKETITSLVLNGTDLTFVDEAGATTTISLCEAVQDCVGSALAATGLVAYDDAGNGFKAGGTAGQVPVSDGAGVVTWGTPASGGGSVTITSPDNSITVGGSASAPTLVVSCEAVQDCAAPMFASVGFTYDDAGNKVTSGAATNGQVLTANGTGGATWQTPAAGGTPFVPFTFLEEDFSPPIEYPNGGAMPAGGTLLAGPSTYSYTNTSGAPRTVAATFTQGHMPLEVMSYGADGYYSVGYEFQIDDGSGYQRAWHQLAFKQSPPAGENQWYFMDDTTSQTRYYIVNPGDTLNLGFQMVWTDYGHGDDVLANSTGDTLHSFIRGAVF